MFSIRSKITLLNVIGVAVSIGVATVIGAVSIADYGHENAEKNMSLLCQNGQDSLNNYFKSVEQSVKIISDLISTDLNNIPDDAFESSMPQHMHNADILFASTAKNTNGVFTYYYRIDPDVSNEKGFWYVTDDGGKTFESLTVSDLTVEEMAYDWFRVPKSTGEPIWLNPYLTENLPEKYGDYYVVSYNYPIKRKGNFVGVVGIEISYITLGEQINKIKVLDTGFAFIVNNNDASIIYHPIYDILRMDESIRPSIPDDFKVDFLNGQEHIVYTFEGVEKHCCWLKLIDGMSIVVTAPASEITGTWKSLVLTISLVALGIVVFFAAFSFLSANRITKSLRELTLAAEEINKGNYNVRIDVHGKNEIGTLSQTVNNLIKNLDEYIADLNAVAYSDALTSVGNKSAFDARIAEIQKRIDNKEEDLEFAIAILDCDNLKDINDEFGHDKGDIYLRNSCNFMRRTFLNSIIYRIGGDEFAIILEGEDYRNREQLQKRFITRSAEVSSFAKEKWERIRVSIGIATYDPKIDHTANDVVVHADHVMYVHKRERKRSNKY